MGRDASRAASAAPWAWPAGAPVCPCGTCESERRQAEVRDLLVQLEEPSIRARLSCCLCTAPRAFLAATIAALSGAASMVSRPSVDEWDPY